MRRYTASISIPDSFIEDGTTVEEDIESIKNGALPFDELISIASSYPDEIKIEYTVTDIEEV